MTYRILDLCCGEGGASFGYWLAGFKPYGVDHEPMKRYPFNFILGDAMELPAAVKYGIKVGHFHAIHAAPPCQRWSTATPAEYRDSHPDLIEPMREFLRSTGLPYVIENVPPAPLEDPIQLCGSSFGLQADDEDGTRLWLKRHRRFETGGGFKVPGTQCNHPEGMQVAGAYNKGSGHKGSRDGRGKLRGYVPNAGPLRDLFQMPWATVDGIYQATPPVYTEYIGVLLRHYLETTSNLKEAA